MKLTGKSALVTGAASGIGKEIALAYAREGARAAIADINLAAAQDTAEQVRAGGAQALGIGMDVTSEQQVDETEVIRNVMLKETVDGGFGDDHERALHA